MGDLTLRFRFRLGGGSFGTVFATTIEVPVGARAPSTLDASSLFAVKILAPHESIEFPNSFLRNAVRELCASRSMLDDRAAFEGRVPRLADAFFFSASHAADGSPSNSVALVFRKFSCDCGTWFKLGHKLGVLGPEDVTHVMFQLLQAVHTLHASGVAHRDIKPSNMLVDLSTGDIALGDFGFVSLLEAPMTRKARVDLCTLDTRAPELCVDAEEDGTLPAAVGVKSDMWSLGITLLCALVGRESQPLGSVMDMEGDKKRQREFLRARFSGTFAPLGPDPGPHPATVLEWLARVFGASSDLPAAAKALKVRLTTAQAFVLTQCLRLNPAERPSAKELLAAINTNEHRGFDPDKMASLMPVLVKTQGVLQARAHKEQADKTMPSSVVVGTQHLLDGKSFAAGQDPPKFVAEPFRGLDKRGVPIEQGVKERARTLHSMTAMLRCLESKPDGAKRLCMSDMLLVSVDLFDRLMSPAVLSRMRSMTDEAVARAKVEDKPLKGFLTDKLADKAWTFERRDLQIVCIFLADLVLQFDGQNLRRIVYVAYPRKCNIFAEEASRLVHEALWELKMPLVVQWVFEALRSLDFDVVQGSLLRALQRRGALHRHRPTVLGVLKALETTPSQALALDRVPTHDKPLTWGSGEGAQFDVDF